MLSQIFGFIRNQRLSKYEVPVSLLTIDPLHQLRRNIKKCHSDQSRTVTFLNATPALLKIDRAKFISSMRPLISGNRNINYITFISLFFKHYSITIDAGKLSAIFVASGILLKVCVSFSVLKSTFANTSSTSTSINNSLSVPDTTENG